MKFKFLKRKYKRELLIDCGKMPEVNFVLDHTPFMVDFHEILIITSGKGVFRLDNELINFCEGTLLLLRPNKWRQWQQIEEKIDGHFLIFEEEFISNYFNDQHFLYRFHYFYNHTTPSYIQLAPKAYRALLDKIDEIKVELKALRQDSDHLLRSLLYYLLIHINRIYQESFQIKGQFFENLLTLRFRRLLEKSNNELFQVSDYAEALQVSKSHLNKMLRLHLGRSASELIKEKRLADAKRELLYSNSSIAEISYQLNFSGPSNFNRFFKDLVKITPREYRQLHSK